MNKQRGSLSLDPVQIAVNDLLSIINGQYSTTTMRHKGKRGVVILTTYVFNFKEMFLTFDPICAGTITMISKHEIGYRTDWEIVSEYTEEMILHQYNIHCLKLYKPGVIQIPIGLQKPVQ